MRSPTDILKSIATIALFFCALSLSGAAPAVHAQTPTPTPTEEELRLQEQKRLLELQRDIEQAKKAIRDAQPADEEPPKPTATPLSGDTTLDANVKFEVDMVAYLAMSTVASKIADEVRTKTGTKNLAIYDAQVVRDWRFYRALLPAFNAQVEDLMKSYRALLCKDPAEFSTPGFEELCPANPAIPTFEPTTLLPRAFAAGTDILKSFIDLTALFRTDTKIEGKTVTIDESALVAEVFRALKTKSGGPRALYYPEVFPPRLKENSPTVTNVGKLFLFKTEADERIKHKGEARDQIVKDLAAPTAEKKVLSDQLEPLKVFKQRLDNLQAAHDIAVDAAVKKKLKAQMDKVRVEVSELLPMGKTLESLIDELESGIKAIDENVIKPNKKKIAALEADIKQLSELNARFLKFVEEYVKVDDKGSNAIALFIKSEDIDDVMKDGNWLEIKTVSAGGNNRVRKNLIRYFTGAKLDHSGGLIVEWTLYDKTGAVVASDKCSFYKGYMEPKKIRDMRLADAVP